MKLFDCTVVLHGDRNFEVRKQHVTAPEIMILRALHVGKADGVKDIAHVADVERSDARERERLARQYGNDGMGDAEGPRGAALVNKMFGPVGVPLPKDIEAAVLVAVADEDSEPEAETIVPVAEKPAAPVPTAKRTTLTLPTVG